MTLYITFQPSRAQNFVARLSHFKWPGTSDKFVENDMQIVDRPQENGHVACIYNSLTNCQFANGTLWRSPGHSICTNCTWHLAKCLSKMLKQSSLTTLDRGGNAYFLLLSSLGMLGLLGLSNKTYIHLLIATPLSVIDQQKCHALKDKIDYYPFTHCDFPFT